MLRSSYSFRNFVKERVAQIHATMLYASLHPYTTIQKIAHDSTVEYILKNCKGATPCQSPRMLMNLAIQTLSANGYILEFGVYKGASIKHLAKNFPHETVHGFDSFEGLQESWVHNVKGTFTMHGKTPKVPKNVRLHKGYFDATMPEWLAENEGKVAFLHIDCDLRSSTDTVFEHLEGRLQPGTVIVFDDYFNFQNWQEDGHRSFMDCVKRRSIEYSPIGYGYKELAVVIDRISG